MQVVLYLTAFMLILISVDGYKTFFELPIKNAKVNYHRSKICVTVDGEERCVKNDQAPGNAAELANLFHVIQQYESNAPNGNENSPNGNENSPNANEKSPNGNENSINTIVRNRIAQSEEK